MLNTMMENKNRNIRDRNINKTCAFIFHLVFNMMKLLVILLKLIAQINIIKYVRQKHGQSAVVRM